MESKGKRHWATRETGERIIKKGTREKEKDRFTGCFYMFGFHFISLYAWCTHSNAFLL